MVSENVNNSLAELNELEEMERDVSVPVASSIRKLPNNEPPREGLMWVHSHGHEVLALGDVPSPKPENQAVVQRQYFATFESAIQGWGKYGNNRDKIARAREIIDQMAVLESTEPHEYFFTVPSASYLTVVMKNSRHAGRVWLRKTTIHTAKKVDATVPIKNKNYFECTLYDYNEVSRSGGAGETKKKPVCRFSQIQVPLSGKCECGHPDCEYAPHS